MPARVGSPNASESWQSFFCGTAIALSRDSNRSPARHPVSLTGTTQRRGARRPRCARAVNVCADLRAVQKVLLDAERAAAGAAEKVLQRLDLHGTRQ